MSITYMRDFFGDEFRKISVLIIKINKPNFFFRFYKYRNYRFFLYTYIITYKI